MTRTYRCGGGSCPAEALAEGAFTALPLSHREFNRRVSPHAGARPSPPPPVPPRRPAQARALGSGSPPAPPHHAAPAPSPLLQPGEGALLPAGCSEARARRGALATAWGAARDPAAPAHPGEGRTGRRAARGSKVPTGAACERAGAGARSPRDSPPPPHALGSPLGSGRSGRQSGEARNFLVPQARPQRAPAAGLPDARPSRVKCKVLGQTRARGSPPGSSSARTCSRRPSNGCHMEEERRAPERPRAAGKALSRSPPPRPTPYLAQPNPLGPFHPSPPAPGSQPGAQRSPPGADNAHLLPPARPPSSRGHRAVPPLTSALGCCA